MYGHPYPWQVLTRICGLRLSCRLVRLFDVGALQRDLAAVLDRYRPNVHFGAYHDGGWRAIGLVACDGNMDDLTPRRGDYRKTEAMKAAPYIESLIDGLQCQTARVRLMELQPGSNIFWHYDRSDHLAAGSVRLHVPIMTNDGIAFQISHENCRWRPGELWYGDFSFPHRLTNRGATSRVHLVIDCRVNEAIRSLFPPVFLRQERIARRLRPVCQRMNDRRDARRGIRGHGALVSPATEADCEAHAAPRRRGRSRRDRRGCS